MYHVNNNYLRNRINFTINMPKKEGIYPDIIYLFL
nr:MAG TPA: hypothetical protein [Caudoviricetes sp.]